MFSRYEITLASGNLHNCMGCRSVFKLLILDNPCVFIAFQYSRYFFMCTRTFYVQNRLVITGKDISRTSRVDLQHLVLQTGMWHAFLWKDQVPSQQCINVSSSHLPLCSFILDQKPFHCHHFSILG